MAVLTGAEVRTMRARAQGLYGEGGASVEDAVRLAGGLQAQDTKAARLQVRARAHGIVAAGVDDACATPAVVRTWLMRGTLHAVAAADVRWLTALLGPRVAASSRGRRQRLGLDDEVCGRALPALERVLADGPPLTRDDLVARLAGHGVVLDPRSQAPAHLMMYAAARGLVCRGPEAPGDVPTYVLTARWLKDVTDRGPEGDEALAELAVRHATSYGPVTASDLARWSGLPLGSARRGLAAAGERLARVAVPGGPDGAERADGPSFTAADAAAPPPADPGASCVRLIGHFDPYLLGYQDRDLLLPAAVAARIATGGGFLMPSVLHDGLVVGTWRLRPARGGALALPVELFPHADRAAVSAALPEQAADLSRFLGAPVSWSFAADL